VGSERAAALKSSSSSRNAEKPAQPGEGANRNGRRSGKGQRRRSRRIEFAPDIWLALDRLAKDRMTTIRELADEAFRDL
jgi:hypothetical protein